MVGVWIDPVIAQLMMTFDSFFIIRTPNGIRPFALRRRAARSSCAVSTRKYVSANLEPAVLTTAALNVKWFDQLGGHGKVAALAKDASLQTNCA